MPAIKYIFDRLDGRPKETIEMSEKRGDIPDDPEERRALAERIEKELGLARAVREPAPDRRPKKSENKGNE